MNIPPNYLKVNEPNLLVCFKIGLLLLAALILPYNQSIF